jgi:Family of unknown function (DUF6152)
MMDMRSFATRFVVAFMLVDGAPVEAHHSFAGTYDMSKEIVFTGKVVEVSLRSPHSFFFVESANDKGITQRWAIEGASPHQFALLGFTKDSLSVGDVVEIVGNPARHGGATKRARLIRIMRPSDGWSWGARPGEIVQ